MLAIERRRVILARLNANGKVIVAELAKEFDVTEETIRRDLDRLEKEGLASKTYGGAVASKRIMPDGMVVEEEVLIASGFKTSIKKDETVTVYVVNGIDKPADVTEDTEENTEPISRFSASLFWFMLAATTADTITLLVIGIIFITQTSTSLPHSTFSLGSTWVNGR